MVPLWLHIFVVLCLLASNAITFVIGLRWNRRLKNALDVREVLLDHGSLSTAQIAAGGTMVVTVN